MTSPSGPPPTVSTDDVRDLFDAAVAAKARAYAPYSTFRVGCALRTAGGLVVSGCNVENAAYPQGSCAEAGAISAMIVAGELRIVEILVVTDGEGLNTCCGGCRQRLREFAALDTEIHVCGPEGVRSTFTLEQLLPWSFGPENLSSS